MPLLSHIAASNLVVRAEKTLYRSARALGLERRLFPLHASFRAFCEEGGVASKSQIGQDMFVLWALCMKRDGFFVDVGAASGVELSNTFVLEKDFGWGGICSEPGRGWHKQLHRNRQCAIDERCVWSASSVQLEFMECSDRELSTVASFASSDDRDRSERGADAYRVESVTLTELLIQHSAPQLIDYLSIDTEGSELDILAAHDFKQFSFRAITVEHNRVASKRVKIARLLMDHGYRRVMPSLSKFDDWYLLQPASGPS